MANHITGEMIHELIYGPLVSQGGDPETFAREGGMSPIIQARFESEQIRRQIEVPDTTDVLHTAQLALVKFVI